MMGAYRYLLLAAAIQAAPALAQGITIAGSLVVRSAPRADAPEVAAVLGGTRASAAPVTDAPGWVRLTGTDGKQLGYARLQDLQPAPARQSLLTGALTSGPSPVAGGAADAPQPERGSRLSDYLQKGGGNRQANGNLELSALTDGRLAQAQSAYAAEQRRLAEIAAAQRRAAEAERAAREAEDRARMEMERIERAEQRAAERRTQQAGDDAIANAIRGAALSIGNAMADNLRASNARMQAESQQRMADANRRAAELKLAAARADAERARREASAAAARAQQVAAAPAQQRSAAIDYTARAQAQRAAEARFQQQQAAAQQAQRAQALAVQRQASLMNSGTAGSSGGSAASTGNFSGTRTGSGSVASQSSPASSSSGSVAPAAVAGLDINYPSVGSGSGSRQVGQLQVSLTVRDINVNGDKSRICADFRNPLAGEWRGGYRLTSRYDTQTFATLAVGPGETKTVCEILPVMKTYYVVLRQNAAPRSRDTAFGIRG